MQKAAHAYLQTNLTTNSPGATIVMLYDGALKFLNRAKEQIEAKDYAQKGISISKAMDIISELSAALNRDKGGELADNLYQLYFWCNTKLAMANLKMDTDIIDSVIKVLSGLRGAFVQIQNDPEALNAAEQLAVQQSAGVNQQARNIPGAADAAPPPSANSNLRGRNMYSKMVQMQQG